jgi:hypothetical protein
MNQAKAKTTLSDPVAAVALLFLAIACALFLFAQPREVTPMELPILTLPEAPVRAVLLADARDAAAAPSTPEAQALEALVRQQGEAEDRGFEDVDVGVRRHAALHAAYAIVVERAGEAAALRLRAKSVEALEAALDLRLPLAERKHVMGAFATALLRDGVTRTGYMVAPHFVVRTLYKARWNVLAGVEPDHGFARVERRAYFGYQALHADQVPLTRRIEALHAYGKAGGEDLEEALGTLLFFAHNYPQAAKAFDAAQRAHGNLRARNYAIAARAMASL